MSREEYDNRYHYYNTIFYSDPSFSLWASPERSKMTRDAPDTVFAGYPAGQISG
jgi:hypothetical protein